MARLEISPAERARVTRAIAAAEENTSGEIVVVLARQSDDYIHVPLHIAAVVALAVPLLLPWLAGLFPWAAVSFWWLYLAQLACFIIVALVLSLDPLRYHVTPRRLMTKYAHRHAAAQFLSLNLHTTRGRTGILIFVSLLEHYCEVVGDTEIAAKVPRSTWQQIVDEMVTHLRRGDVAEGLVHGVERSGDILARHVPPGRSNPDELPNHLIVLD